MNMNNPRRPFLITSLVGAALLAATPLYAVPTLQIDINGGSYVGAHPIDSIADTTLTGDSVFVLDAILTQNGNPPGPLLTDEFFLVVSFLDSDGNGVSGIGADTFDIDGR